MIANLFSNTIARAVIVTIIALYLIYYFAAPIFIQQFGLTKQLWLMYPWGVVIYPITLLLICIIAFGAYFCIKNDKRYYLYAIAYFTLLSITSIVDYFLAVQNKSKLPELVRLMIIEEGRSVPEEKLAFATQAIITPATTIFIVLLYLACIIFLFRQYKKYTAETHAADTNETQGFTKEEARERIEDFEVQNYLFQETFKSNYKTLSKGQKMLHTIFILEGDVDNGGYVQYLQNQKDEYFEDTFRAFKLLGDKKGYTNFSEAVKIYRRNEDFLSAKDLDAPFKEKDAEKLEKLENQFYEYAELRKDLVTKYLRTHINEFYPTK